MKNLNEILFVLTPVIMFACGYLKGKLDFKKDESLYPQYHYRYAKRFQRNTIDSTS